MKSHEKQSEGRLPLVVTLGISGHRKPEQLGDLEQLNALLIQEIRRVRDHLVAQNGEVSFLTISPLADGADRIFARAVWEVDPEARLIVPLPFDKGEYEASFFHQESVQEFNELLDQPNCLEHFVIEGGRSDEYLEVGKYVVDHADVMFFLHDGADFHQAPMDGGTSSVLHYARFTPTSDRPADASKSGTNRESDSERKPCVVIDTMTREATVYLPNREEPVNPSSVDPAVFKNSHARLLDGMDPLHPWTGGREELSRHLNTLHYNAFDKPAGEHQKSFDRQGTLIIAMAFLVGLNVLLDWFTGGNDWFKEKISEGWPTEVLNWDTLCLAGLLVIIITVYFFRHGDWLQRWVEKRYLAEATRHMGDLLLAGVPMSTIICHARHEPVALSLTRVWHSLYLQAHLSFHQEGAEPITAREIRARLLHEEGLILDQLNWHKGRAHQKWRTENRYGVARTVFFALSGGAAIVAAYAVIVGTEGDTYLSISWSNWIDLVASSASLALAGVAAMAQVKEHGKMASRYQGVARQLENLFRHVTFTSQGGGEHQRDALLEAVLEANRILRMATNSWIHTMESKDPDYS